MYSTIASKQASSNSVGVMGWWMVALVVVVGGKTHRTSSTSAAHASSSCKSSIFRLSWCRCKQSISEWVIGNQTLSNFKLHHPSIIAHTLHIAHCTLHIRRTHKTQEETQNNSTNDDGSNTSRRGKSSIGTILPLPHYSTCNHSISNIEIGQASSWERIMDLSLQPTFLFVHGWNLGI